MNPKIKIIIVDNHELFRKSLVALLKTNSDYDVVADVADNRELISKLKYVYADIVILDLELLSMTSNTFLEIIRRRFADLKVVLLSEQPNAQLQAEYMVKGVNSFLTKNCSVETLFTTLNKVKRDGFYFDETTAKGLLDTIVHDRQNKSPHDKVTFNGRETDVMKQICDGKTNKEIAETLHLSSSTIDFYRSKIYSKAKCNNVAHLIKYALRNGFISIH